VLNNGNFEAGFDETGIAHHWKGFTNVDGRYGWSDETWPGLVPEGQHAQVMQISYTLDQNTYIGIYQTVSVMKRKPYDLEIHGLIRSTAGSPQKSSWGYRVQWGIDPKGGKNWKAVEEWTDVGWDDQPLNVDSYTHEEYKTTLIPTGRSLTLFIRGWRKWPTENHEGDFVIDNVRLTGPKVGGTVPSNLPGTGVDWTWP